MATQTWTGVFGGNWSDPTGWSGGTVPAAGDTVQLSAALNGSYTVHLDANEGTYAALAVSAANATLALYFGGLTLSVSGATTLSAGDVAIAGAATLDTGSFAESGGFLGMSNGTVAASGQATLSGGALAVYGGTLQAAALALSGSSFGISGGGVTVTNQVSLTAGTAGFYGGTFNAGSLAVSGGSLGMSGGTIAVSGALTLSGAGSIGLYNTAATLDAGSLAQTGGKLGMSGGTLAVGGLASFTGGSDVLYGGSTLTAGSLQIGASGSADTLTVNGAKLAVSGTATVASGSTLSLYGGSLTTQGSLTDSGTISGAGTLGGPISGTGVIDAVSGTLDLTGTVASGPSLEFASGGDLKIDGTVTTTTINNWVDVNQKLEVGPTGTMTFTAGTGDTSGTILMDGGTINFEGGFRGGAVNDFLTGTGTVNGNEVGFGYDRGATIIAQGGTLTMNGDIYEGNLPQIAAGSTFVMLGDAQLSPTGTGPVKFSFLASSGTLVLGNSSALQAFESNASLSNMTVGSSPTVPTDILDLATVAPGSITSANVAGGNTIDLYSGTTLADHFALASSVGSAVVHWTSDGGAGTSVYLATT